MTIAICAIILSLIVAAIVGYVQNDTLAGAVTAVGLLAPVLIVWAVIAWPLSAYQKDVCQEKAAGYGLERSEWSIRHSCRVYLAGGELVPEGRIRITSDGDIIVTDE